MPWHFLKYTSRTYKLDLPVLLSWFSSSECSVHLFWHSRGSIPLTSCPSVLFQLLLLLSLHAPPAFVCLLTSSYGHSHHQYSYVPLIFTYCQIVFAPFFKSSICWGNLITDNNSNEINVFMYTGSIIGVHLCKIWRHFFKELIRIWYHSHKNGTEGQKIHEVTVTMSFDHKV